MQDSVTDLVSRHEEAALSALNAATGGAPLCRVDGTRQGVKESEGAAAALGDVRRALAREPERDAGAVLDEVGQQWQRLDGPLAQRPDTQLYLTGGAGALRALREDLTAAAPRVTPLAATIIPEFPVEPQQMGKWTRRRMVAAVLIFVLLGALIVTSGEWSLVAQPVWSLLVLGVGGLSSATLALFVPQQGCKPDLGCAPCAVMGAAVAVGAPAAAIWSAHDLGWALLALVMSVAALVRKQLDPGYCGQPTG